MAQSFPALAVVSGKGGVGKTLISASLVQALKRYYKIGAIDADYSNPNLGRFLNIDTDIQISPDKKVIPALKDGINFFSIEKVVGSRGVSMRGQDYAEITRDIIQYAAWNIDLMLIDMPAVIADEFKVILSVFDNRYLGSIVVAQPSHLETTERVLKIHQLNGVPVLGIIENMVGFTCSCGKTHNLFGAGGGEELARRYNVPLLATIPLLPDIPDQLTKGAVSLPEEYLAPAIDSITHASPRRLGFLDELKQGIKEISRDVVIKTVVTSMVIINRTVNIKELQTKYNFMDQATVEMKLLKDDGSLIGIYNFRVADGKLMIVEKPKAVDMSIEIKASALIWSILGTKKFPDGTEIPYSIVDAYVNGDARVSGAGAVVKGIRFFRELYEQSREKLLPELKPLLVAIA